MGTCDSVYKSEGPIILQLVFIVVSNNENTDWCVWACLTNQIGCGLGSSMPTHTNLYFHWLDTTVNTICNFIGPSLLYTLSVILLVTKHRL